VLVYGDHSEFGDPRERLERISEAARRVAAMPAGVERHAQLVGALIEAGRVLQGVADADFEIAEWDRATEETRALTRWLHALATAMCRSWDSEFRELGEGPPAPEPVDLPGRVELRTPEGFAFYALYPEAYIEAARRVRLTAPPRVIGIRSVGTTLGAVVASAVGAPPPVSVRPHGDPFVRKIAIAAELERELLAGDAHYIIVDEGPGLSGSSFGAVADWLQERGVPLERIAFLPSHSAEPGPQCSEGHQVRWRRAQRHPATLEERLPQLLQCWLALDEPLIDISGGEWRSRIYSSEKDWPAAVPPWERLKFLASARGETLLVKFAGLGAIGQRKFRMARALHAAGLASEPLALVHGFLVERWCGDASPLAPGDKPMEQIAAYIGARARLFPAQESEGASLDRLLEMCRRNVSLSLGDQLATSLDGWETRTGPLCRRVVRVRTDNRLDRHEWLRCADGRLLKTDALDHHAAHDLIGCQDLAWDVAGGIVEFGLDEGEAERLVAATERASGRQVDRELLEFHRFVYCCFRLGQATLGAEICRDDTAERERLTRNAQCYAAGVNLLLHQYDSRETRQESLVG
jgi:hypothetical protein